MSYKNSVLKIGLIVALMFLCLGHNWATHAQVEQGPPAVSAKAAGTPLTQLSMSGESGDYIGGNTNYFYTPSTGTFSASAQDRNADGKADWVQISYMDSNHWWYFFLGTDHVSGQNLVPGFYDNAQRAPFASSGHPGIDIFGDGRGCNTITGNFTVHEATFDYSTGSPKVLNFTASFEQHCEGGPAALLGTIYYNYTDTISPTFTISGKISNNLGGPVANLPIVLGGSQTLNGSTDSSGNYAFNQLLGSGNFKITPAAGSAYILTPTTQSVKRLTADQTVNFTAVSLYKISGQILNSSGSPLTGVSVSVTGTQTANTVTDNNGNYSISNLRADGNFTVTPARTNYGFTPASRSFNGLTEDTTVNFTGALLTYTLAGRVIDNFGAGIAQATVSLSGSQATATQTDGNGNYSFSNVTAAGSYTVTPSKINYTFVPISQNFSNLSGSFGAINFTGTLKTYTISGLVLDITGNGIPSLVLTLSGSQSGTTASDSNGNYSFTIVAGGTYTVTPTNGNYSFSPASRVFTNVSSNQAGSFVATPNSIQFNASSHTVNESAGFATITVTRSGDTSAPATVKYATSDTTDVNFKCNPATAGQVSGVASRKCDYHMAAGRLRFAAGESSKVITLSIVNDVYVEPSESLTITLSSPTGAPLGTPITATVTITDDDAPGLANPIDGTAFYVRMLYVDLLSREPDPAGNAGWIRRIDFCGQPGEPPPPCDRVTVGGDGFLRSSEFFDREFFVIRLYRAALGRIPRYDDLGDLAYLSGFLTDGDLESNKQELVTEIMSRSEFSNIYNSLTNSQYVDTMIQTAAVTLPAGVRDSWVSALSGSTKTRAVVFRELSERPEVSAKYLHEAQVVSCYYGFFTRNPDGAYLNYLQRLDSGEINLGDLANAFINAAEYRQRFGP